MAPEVRHSSESTFEADIWSIGAIVFWLKTKKKMKQTAGGKKQFEEEFATFEKTGKFPAKLMDFIKKTMAYDPAERGDIPDLLQHEWIKEYAKDLDDTLTESKYQEYLNDKCDGDSRIAD